MNCYPFIEAEKSAQRNVKRACELLKVSRSAYYAARGDEPSQRAREDAELAAQVMAVHSWVIKNAAANVAPDVRNVVAQLVHHERQAAPSRRL